MNTRDKLAMEIFLKRLPAMPLNQETLNHFRGQVDQSYEIADVFIRRQGELRVEAIESMDKEAS